MIRTRCLVATPHSSFTSSMEYRPNSRPERSHDIPPDPPIQEVTDDRIRYRAMVRWRDPRYLSKALYSERLRSFNTWPRLIPPTVERLSAAGFFHNGKVSCIILLLSYSCTVIVSSLSYRLFFRDRRSVCLFSLRCNST